MYTLHAEFSILVVTERKMILLAILLFSCIVAVQAIDAAQAGVFNNYCEELGDIAVVLSEDTVLRLNCTGTRHSTPNVVINDVLISSIHATDLLTNFSIEESVLRDSTGRLVLSFKLHVTSETRLTFECDRSSNYCYKLKLADVREYHPPPVTVKYSHNSSTIQLQWHLPYSTVNNHHHGIFLIEPQILQYTVYTIDDTGMIIGRVNTTETGLTLSNAPDDNACLIYKVSTWNNNGEGEMSEPVCGSLLHYCQRDNTNTTTATSATTATTTTDTKSSTATFSTEGDTKATIDENQHRDDTTLIATVAVAGAVTVVGAALVVPTAAIIGILIWMKHNKKGVFTPHQDLLDTAKEMPLSWGNSTSAPPEVVSEKP